MFIKSSLSLVTVFAAVLLSLPSVLGAPIPHAHRRSKGSSPSSALEKRAPGGAPYFVAYQNSGEGPPPVDRLRGFNTYILAFWQTNGVQDKAAAWAALPEAERKRIKTEYNAAGIRIMVSLFGAENKPSSLGADPVQVGNSVAEWVKTYGVDGVDVDYEDEATFNSGSGQGEQFVIALTQTLRQQLPQGQYIISHAPLAPWFSPGKYGGGGYLRVNTEVGAMIDFYNIQFYNQRAYTNCAELVDSSIFPGSSVMEISAAVGKDKVVIGKPGLAGDANDGFIEPAVLADCVADAKGKGWNGGVMVWQYPSADTNWITTVRSKAFPL